VEHKLLAVVVVAVIMLVQVLVDQVLLFLNGNLYRINIFI
jgi:hypothetical protein